MRRSLFFLSFCLIYSFVIAQETFPTNGARYDENTIYVFKNATIYLDYETKVEGASLVVQNGKIINVGSEITDPKNAVRIDLDGKVIYPSFIDLHSNYGLPKVKPVNRSRSPQYVSRERGALYWNEAIHPEYQASKEFQYDDKQATELRNIGFGLVLSNQANGIARGIAALINLSNKNENQIIEKAKASSNFSFDKGNSPNQYPSSQMGSIALLRQAFYDAKWYKSNKESEVNVSLDELNEQSSLPKIFEVKDKLEIFRANKIAKEFNYNFILKSVGNEYQRADALAKENVKLIIPLVYPKAYDVSDPFDAKMIQLSQMKHWELAPKNAAILADKGIDFCITSSDLKSKKEFLTNLRKAVEYGLSEENALKSLTHNPAKFLNVENQFGSLKKGMSANFIICSDNIFDKKAQILENWIDGKKYIINEEKTTKYDGVYSLGLNGKNYDLKISEKKSELKIDSTKIKVVTKKKENLISMKFSLSDSSNAYFFTGYKVGQNIEGTGVDENGDVIQKFIAQYKKSVEVKKDTAKENEIEVGDIVYPFVGYGFNKIPKQEEIIFKNATVWTNEIEGILQKSDVHIKDGKIVTVGNNLSSSTAKIVDATGLHLTSGIIDEHSHIAISKGVNESGQASTAEVSIGDVVNSEDINIYRQLAGGVTASQLLHGSANPIGGQSALIKLRWGSLPEEMKIEGADGFIKFALGENVKQSNWGDFQTVRFPQTRMGVEQVYFDHFIRAKEYQEKWNAYNALSNSKKKKTIAPRKDIEMETISEILNKRRFITCHSYQQGEINMLMKVADSMKFTVNTFTHILEGYKVADKMKAHGVGASTFSDWWAYKFEVNDAIPYNGAILHKQGIVTAYNSDDAEMGRRLNQEAAKAVKYGGVSEEEAWKFVTLNPAKLLHLDDKMGSIKVGKDADIVLWTDNPLSVYAKVKMTYVDGKCLYDSEKEKEKQEEIRKERNRLIQKMLGQKKAGKPTQKPQPKKEILYHCDTE